MGFGLGWKSSLQSVAQSVTQLVGQALNVASLHTTGPIVGVGAGTGDLGTRVAGNTALWLGVTPSVSNYAVSSSSLGDTTVNASTGQSVSFAVNNGITGSIGATGLTIGSGGITLNGAGAVAFPNTDSSGTPGNATANTPVGKAAIASGATACVISNTLVTANSRIMISPRIRDATGLLPIVSAQSAGVSFTVSVNAACTANLPFDWWVIS